MVTALSHCRSTTTCRSFWPLQEEEEKATSKRTGRKRKSFTAIHLTPQNSLVCVCPPGKENAQISVPSVTRWGAGRHCKNREGVQPLNALNQERYNVQRLAGGPLTKAKGEGMFIVTGLSNSSGWRVKADFWRNAHPIRGDTLGAKVKRAAKSAERE